MDPSLVAARRRVDPSLAALLRAGHLLVAARAGRPPQAAGPRRKRKTSPRRRCSGRSADTGSCQITSDSCAARERELPRPAPGRRGAYLVSRRTSTVRVHQTAQIRALGVTRAAPPGAKGAASAPAPSRALEARVGARRAPIFFTRSTEQRGAVQPPPKKEDGTQRDQDQRVGVDGGRGSNPPKKRWNATRADAFALPSRAGATPLPPLQRS